MTESERIDRFEEAYNRIDHALGDVVGGDRRKTGFSAKVRIAGSRRRHLARYKDYLLEIGELRNALVHSRTGQNEYIAVPSEKTVLELERIEKAAFSPQRVMPRFARHVMILNSNQSIVDAWKVMRDDGYSRYPVYENGSGAFLGLLTANGFARWAASQLQGTRLDVDMAHVRVADVLAHDRRSDMVSFVSREALIDDVDDLFHEVKPPEAVLITEHGKPEETPIGIISATDIAAVNK